MNKSLFRQIMHSHSNVYHVLHQPMDRTIVALSKEIHNVYQQIYTVTNTFRKVFSSPLHRNSNTNHGDDTPALTCTL